MVISLFRVTDWSSDQCERFQDTEANEKGVPSLEELCDQTPQN